MLQILIVDDHAIVRRGLMQILTDEPDLQVAGTGDAHDAFRRILEHPWDLVVLDLDLPGKSGLDLLKEIRQERPRLPVLILSVHLPEQFAVRTLRAGASGFLSKDAAPDELVTAIRRILRGGTYITAPTADRLVAGLTGEDDGDAPRRAVGPGVPDPPAPRRGENRDGHRDRALAECPDGEHLPRARAAEAGPADHRRGGALRDRAPFGPVKQEAHAPLLRFRSSVVPETSSLETLNKLRGTRPSGALRGFLFHLSDTLDR